MSEHEQEQTAEQREQARLDKAAAENEAVRRAEHPEEFAHENDEARAAAPVAPASGTGADTTTHEPDPEELVKLSELERAAADKWTGGHAREVLERAARDLREKLFGPPTL